MTQYRSDVSVGVARLSSADHRHTVAFTLKRIDDPHHADWHSYELSMIGPQGNVASLVSNDEHTLFLDKTIAPEVPALCAGIADVVANGGRYLFEPVDERDFLLEVEASAGRLVLRLQYRWNPAPEEFGWPVGLPVDPKALLEFCRTLEALFLQVIA